MDKDLFPFLLDKLRSLEFVSHLTVKQKNVSDCIDFFVLLLYLSRRIMDSNVSVLYKQMVALG